MEAICEELGLTLETGEVEDNGDTKAETFGFPKEEVEALSEDQLERLAQLRHELLVDATGTKVSFSTREFQPGSHNVHPDETKVVRREWISIEVDAETMHNVFSLAAVGSAMLGQALGKKMDPLKMQNLLATEFPDAIAAQRALYKIEETTSIIEREHTAYGQAKGAAELAAFIESDADLFVSDITGEEG